MRPCFIFAFVAFFFNACSNHQSKSSNKKIAINLNCDSFIVRYSKLRPCEKLTFVKLSYPVNNSCYEYISSDMYKLTGISSSMTYGHTGSYYLSDSLLKKDLDSWALALKCIQ